MSAMLYLVPTPIGNLNDISPRCRQTLAEADFIAAEDTRVSLKLLNHLELKKSLVSYHEHNKAESGEKILARLLAGETCALVTDAGYVTAGGRVLGVTALGAALGTLGMVDYYGAGVLTVFIFYFFHGHKWWCLLGQLAALYWVNVELLGGLMYPIQLFGMDFELCQQGLALLALVPIWLYRGRQGYHSKPFQYACYAFYPVHMLLLALVLNFVNR